MVHELSIGESALLTDIAMCVNYYRLFSPGLYCCVHASVQLDGAIRRRPGIVVMVNHGELRQCEPDADYGHFVGPPNFVLDVFSADGPDDYEDRRSAYERAQVLEYVAVRDSDPVRWTWNRLVDGRFTKVEAADGECIRSSALPGLWIPAVALKTRDWWTIMGSIARGVTRIEHHRFMETIWAAGTERK